MRRVLCVAIVALLPWLIAPGRIQPDTKADLTLAPWDYLARSLWAWNDHSGWGELQNQAYGYLFPMGSFFGLIGEVLPAWAVQRAWWSLLLVVAFVGATRLATRLGAASGSAALVAGFVYALSSRVVTVLPEISIEVWPMALAPWLVLAAMPLVDGETRGRGRLSAFASTGLLVAALGGVNATASLVVLALPGLYLMTAPAASRKLSALMIWGLAVTAGAFWWLAPLFLLGRYAYPFLDHIESAAMTNAVTSLPNVLRGASHWVAYIIDPAMHPVWQSGWYQAQSVTAILASSLVAGAGLLGLVLWRRSRANHATRFAMTSLLIGLALLTLGYGGFAGSPIADQVQAFLDGPGAPLRNVHKADPLIRLPIALGLAVLVARIGQPSRERIIAVVALAALVISPVAWWSGRGGDAWAYEAVPGAWADAAETVDAMAARDGGATLLLPGSRTAHYAWGRPNDEPLSAWADSPVMVRNSAPLGHVGAWQAMDRLELFAASGASQPHLAQAYARFGISRIVVRRTLDDSTQAEPFAAVERTLESSAGFTLVEVNDELSLWRVEAPVAEAGAFESSTTTAAGADGMADLIARGLIDPNTAIVVGSGRPDWATDTSREQVYNNGLPSHAARGATRDTSDSGRSVRRADQIRAVTVSSSAADPFGRGFLGPHASQWSALDGDPETEWISGRETRSTFSLEFDEPRPGELAIDVVSRRGVLGARNLEVVTPDERHTVSVVDGTASVHLAQTSRVEIRFPELDRPVQRGISEIRLDGHEFGVATHVDATIGEQSVLLTRDPRDRLAPERLGEEGSRLRWVVDSVVTGSVSATVTSTRADGTAVSRPVELAVTVGQTRIELVDAPGERIRSVVIDAPEPSGAPTTAMQFSRESSGRYAVTLPAGVEIVALAQSANDGWRARIDGRTLDHVTVDGWRQGFVVPAGAHGTIDIEFTPNRWHQAGLVAGAVLVVVLALLFLIARPAPVPREAPPAAAAARWWPAWLVAGSVVIVAGAIGGLWGAGVGALSLLVPRRHLASAIVATAIIAGVGLAFFGVVAHDSIGAMVGQLAALATLSVTVRAFATPPAREPSA